MKVTLDSDWTFDTNTGVTVVIAKGTQIELPEAMDTDAAAQFCNLGQIPVCLNYVEGGTQVTYGAGGKRIESAFAPKVEAKAPAKEKAPAKAKAAPKKATKAAPKKGKK